MLIRVRGGAAGIKEYLESGHKDGRDYDREQLDERVVLSGDLELTDTVIGAMEKEGERYLHITLAFKEDELKPEILQAITDEFKEFAMTAYDSDEYNFYAEAHLPKLKSYVNQKTGEFVERKPHIHIVIPEHNLLSGQSLNPFGRVEQQTKFLEAFQEHINNKYGLASPKDNRRVDFSDESAVISRYKGDYFKGASGEAKQRILDAMIDGDVRDYAKFRALVAGQGELKVRNQGKATEYLNVKPNGAAKGINLKEYVFSREFVELPASEKRAKLAATFIKEYVEASSPRPTDKDISGRLKEWQEVRAREVKYINSGNGKLYSTFKDSDQEARRAILNERAATFYNKHRALEEKRSHAEQRNHAQQRSLEQWGKPYEYIQHTATEKPNLGLSRVRAGSDLRNLSECHLATIGGQRSKGVLQIDARSSRYSSDRVRREPTDAGRNRGSEGRAAAQQPKRDGRASDTVAEQLAAEQRERKGRAAGKDRSEFTTIKRELEGARLLAILSQTHGVIPEKYEVSKGKDGSDRIRCGNRNLNVSDFLTQEMRLPWAEAAKVLREAHAAQVSQEPTQQRQALRRELWEAYRQSLPEQAKQKAQEWEAQKASESRRRAEVRAKYQTERREIQNDRSSTPAERKAALSIVSMGRVAADAALREKVAEERQQLRTKYAKPGHERYRDYLADRANQGDTAALAELRRQRTTAATQHGPNTIEGMAKPKKAEDRELAPVLAYTVDRSGNVTYYADQEKRRAVLIDSGHRVTVADSKDSKAVEAGLRLAVQKFGPNIKLEGSEEFKRQVIEAALKTGVRVEFSNDGMNVELHRRRAEREEAQQRGKAFIESQRRAEAVPVENTQEKGQERAQGAEQGEPRQTAREQLEEGIKRIEQMQQEPEPEKPKQDRGMSR